MPTPDDDTFSQSQEAPEMHSLATSFPDLESLNLHPYSRLEVLPCYETTVEVHEPGKVIMEAFEAYPHLPGIIVQEGEKVVGMISRQRFLFQMSQPYSLELYVQRPIQRFLGMFNTSMMELSSQCLITQAVQMALTRPYQCLYEPVVVRFGDGQLKVLDLHLLLLAQSQLLMQVTQLQAQTQAQLQQQNEALKATETALRQANQELHRQATQDSLTGVSNRRQFETVLRQEWQRLRRTNSPLSLIICDVDNFKRYNDTYGHQAGDSCLRAVAQTMKQVTKRTSDLVSRYGGEEFTLLLPNTPLSGAKEVAQLLRQSLAGKGIPHRTSQVSRFVTVSIGISSLIPNGEISPETLILQADRALYVAKEQGRDRAITYDSII